MAGNNQGMPSHTHSDSLRVMILGASTNQEKFGNKAVRAYVAQGHQVFPVNPRADVIEGLKCYPDIASVPGPIDRALFYLPPALGLAALEELAQRGDVAEAWLNPGAESPEILKRARELKLETVQACAIMDIGFMPD